jgi:hypothetical protein
MADQKKSLLIAGYQRSLHPFFVGFFVGAA